MKSGTRYFRVVNLEKYQHYKHRNPPWIKLHASTLEDYDFGRLQDASKMHLCAIWLLASRTGNKIPYDAEWIAKKIDATSNVDLAALEYAGFIELTGDASDSLATCKQSAPPETERERESEREKPTPKPPPAPPENFTKFWEAYPRNAMGRKVGKQAALKRWKTIKPTPELAAQILAALATQTSQHHWRNGKGEDYVPNPATWLNEGRWEDEVGLGETQQERKDRESEQIMKQARLEITRDA